NVTSAPIATTMSSIVWLCSKRRAFSEASNIAAKSSSFSAIAPSNSQSSNLPRAARRRGLIEHGQEKRLHGCCVVHTVLRKCRLRRAVGLPVEERMARTTHLHVFCTLSSLDQRIDELLDRHVCNQWVCRAARQELRDGSLRRRGDMTERRDRFFPRLIGGRIIRIGVQHGRAEYPVARGGRLDRFRH